MEIDLRLVTVVSLLTISSILVPATAAVPDSLETNPVTQDDTAVCTNGYENPSPREIRERMNSSHRITTVYPDSYLNEDAGEYVSLWFGSPTNTSGWTLSDGESTFELPSKTLEGTVHFVKPGTENESGIDGYTFDLNLANSGDEVIVRNPNGVVDKFSYGEDSDLDPSEGEIIRWSKNEEKWTLKELGSTNFPYSTYNFSEITAFVAPDSAGKTVDEAFDSAKERILVNAYEFDSRYLASSLIDAEERGVEVKVLVEGSPPGGFESDDAAVLNDLVDAGAKVSIIENGWSRYRFVHAKYAVIDSRRVIVTSENWKSESMSPSADGSRGWGVTVKSQGVARRFTQVFRNDSNWNTVKNFSTDGFETQKPRNSSETDGWKSKIETERYSSDSGDRIGVALAPDSSLKPVVDLIESAEKTLYVQQAYIRKWDGRPNPYLEAVIEKARDGVEVRVLLDGRWFTREKNSKIVNRLNRIAEEEGLDMKAKLSEKPVHNKGVVVDSESVLVSSINWNQNSVKNNREAALVIQDEETASYFHEAFENDWETQKGSRDKGFNPMDYIIELLIILIVSCIAVWLVFFVMYGKDSENPTE